jgi:acetyl esterase/lipase
VQNAAKYGIDPDRIALIGESAGGHLVLTTGLGDDMDYPCDHSIRGTTAKVRCIVAYYPRVSFVDKDLLISKRSDSEKIDKWMEQVLGASWKSDPAMLHKLSPVELVQSNSPAIQIIHGDQDTILPVSNATAMRDSAAAKGVEVECIIVKGAEHCFDGKEIHPTDVEIEKSTVDFLMRHLAPISTIQATRISL